MTAKRDDLAGLPAWPRGLSREQAASYVGLSVNTFLAEVEAGEWPKAERHGTRLIWDKLEIDEFWNRRKSGMVAPVSTEERAARWGGRSS